MIEELRAEHYVPGFRKRSFTPPCAAQRALAVSARTKVPSPQSRVASAAGRTARRGPSAPLGAAARAVVPVGAVPRDS